MDGAETLSDHGLRRTPQRMAVLRALDDGHALSAQEVFARARTHCPELGLSTVYRTLLALTDAGMLDVIGQHDGEATYRRCGRPITTTSSAPGAGGSRSSRSATSARSSHGSPESTTSGSTDTRSPFTASAAIAATSSSAESRRRPARRAAGAGVRRPPRPAGGGRRVLLARSARCSSTRSASSRGRTSSLPYARLGPIGRGAVELAYWSRPARAFEYWAHAASILPIEDWPWYAMRRARHARALGGPPEPRGRCSPASRPKGRSPRVSSGCPARRSVVGLVSPQARRRGAARLGRPGVRGTPRVAAGLRPRRARDPRGPA